MRYTPSEILAATALVKQAELYGGVGATSGMARKPELPGMRTPGVSVPEMVPDISQYNKLQDYEKWFHPASAFAPSVPKRPGFWSSLGKSVLGTAGAAPLPFVGPTNVGYNLQSFFGLSPGRSGMRNLVEGGADALGDLLTGDTARAGREWRQAWTQGLSAPALRAAERGAPYQTALADWLTGVNKGTAPGKWYKPGEFPGVFADETMMKLLHPLQYWRQRPPIVW